MNNKRITILFAIFMLIFSFWHLTSLDATIEEEIPIELVIETISDSAPDYEESEDQSESVIQNDFEDVYSEEIEVEQYQESTTYVWPMCWREINLEQWEIDFFAQLLFCEAGIMSYEGQFWVASAILNLSELKQMSIWDMGHQINIFEVAPYVDNSTPTQQQYDVIYDALNNGWIADVAYFRTDYPHSFGNFMVQIENVYFSSP